MGLGAATSFRWLFGSLWPLGSACAQGAASGLAIEQPFDGVPASRAGPQRSTLLLKNTIINLEIQNNNNAAITIKVQTRMDNRVRLSVDHRMK